MVATDGGIGKGNEQYRTDRRTVCFGSLTPTEIKPEDDTIYIRKSQKNASQYSGEAVSGTDFRIVMKYAALIAEDNHRRRADTEELRLSYDDFVSMIIRENKVGKLESKFHGDAEKEEIKFREFVRSSNL